MPTDTVIDLLWLLTGAVVLLVIIWLVRVKRSSSPEAQKAQTPVVKVETPAKVSPVSPLDIKFEFTGNYQSFITTTQQESERDEWEGSFWEVAQPYPVKARLHLKYMNGARQRTERTVDVRQFGAFGQTTLLIGHCHLRNATRTFRTDRIQFCVDEETGEVVEDIRGYLRKMYDDSPERSADGLLETEYDTLRVLLYVGKADGQLRAAEKAVIRSTCAVLSNDSRLTDEMISDLLARLDVPTIHAFKLAVGRISKKEMSARQTVLNAAEKIVATQKTVHAAEREALDYMKSRFG